MRIGKLGTDNQKIELVGYGHARIEANREISIQKVVDLTGNMQVTLDCDMLIVRNRDTNEEFIFVYHPDEGWIMDDTGLADKPNGGEA